MDGGGDSVAKPIGKPVAKPVAKPLAKKRPAPAPHPKPAARQRPCVFDESSDEDDDDALPPRPPPRPPTLKLPAPPPAAPAPAAARLAGAAAANPVNRSHVRYLRAKMDAMRADVLSRERIDNASWDNGTLPSWRDAQGKESTSQLLNLEALLETDRDFISYDTFVEITHHQSLMAVLGSVEMHTPFLRWSNKESLTFEHVYQNLEEILTPVLSETDLFSARPEQRLAAAEKLVRYPMDLACSVRRMGELPHQAATFTRPAHCAPEIDLMNLATGNGKTWTAVVATMTELCHPQLWTRLLEGWRAQLKANTTVGNLGLCRCAHLNEQRLVRVAIAFVPKQLLDQWEKTATAVAAAFREEYGTGFVVWRGLNKLERATKENPEGKDRTLVEADETCRRLGCALLWLVPAETESAKKTLRAEPKLAVPIRLYDEMKDRTEPKSSQPESRVLRNRVINATLELLRHGTKNQPNHPFNRALGVSFDPLETSHAGIFHLLTTPDWLRLLVSLGMRSMMPSGIRKVRLAVRMQSLAARVNKSDMNITCLDELLRALLRSAGADHAMSEIQHRAFLRQCRSILAGTAADDDLVRLGIEAEKTIHERLSTATRVTEGQIEALPGPIKPAQPGQPLTQAQLDENANVERTRRRLTAMTRMFNNLAEAVCVDPRPECPISMEPIDPQHVGIFPCCTNLFDSQYKDQLNARCPMCRTPLTNGVIVAAQAVDALVEESRLKEEADRKKRAAAAAAAAAAATAPSDADKVGDEPLLIDDLKSVTSRKPFTMGHKAVVAAIRRYLAFRPTGARILLAYACGAGNEAESTRRTRELIAAELGEALDSTAAVDRKAPASVEAFTTDDATNRLLIINTNDRSASLEGLDLWNTGLVILDKLAPGKLTPGKIVQAVGRAMRPQLKAKDASDPLAASCPRLLDEASPYPAKLVVMLERDDRPAQAGGGAGLVATDDEASDDDDE